MAPRPLLSQASELPFKDLDNETVYQDVQAQVLREEARNFVVEFGADEARIALDLQAAEFEKLLERPVDQARFPVRWINIWGPSCQQDIISHLSSEFDFSERLMNTIKNWDRTKGEVLKPQRMHTFGKGGHHPENREERAGNQDVEQGRDANVEKGSANRAVPSSIQIQLDTAMHRLVHGSLNFISIDQSDEYVCVGANWLHLRPGRKPSPSQGIGTPAHWIWYALCARNTVLSIQEAPQYCKPPTGVDEKHYRDQERASMRQNTFQTLVQLSKCGFGRYDNDMFSQKAVRRPPRSERPAQLKRRVSTMTASDPNRYGAEASSNLFYYLFENYTGPLYVCNAASEVVRKLTSEVLDSGNLRGSVDTSGIVRSLHEVGRELREFIHLFESYKALIQRIIVRQSAGGLEQLDSSTSLSPAGLGTLRLSHSARARFERLCDRLQLQILDWMKEYLEEKSALSDTYFNLTAQKDSQATARLTRSATLLAKLSVLFLPISFITSYYSIQIPNAFNDLTLRTYWVVFGATISVAFVFLFFFSRLLEWISDGLEDGWQRTWALLRVRRRVLNRESDRVALEKEVQGSG